MWSNCRTDGRARRSFPPSAVPLVVVAADLGPVVRVTAAPAVQETQVRADQVVVQARRPMPVLEVRDADPGGLEAPGVVLAVQVADRAGLGADPADRVASRR